MMASSFFPLDPHAAAYTIQSFWRAAYARSLQRLCPDTELSLVNREINSIENSTLDRWGFSRRADWYNNDPSSPWYQTTESEPETSPTSFKRSCKFDICKEVLVAGEWPRLYPADLRDGIEKPSLQFAAILNAESQQEPFHKYIPADGADELKSYFEDQIQKIDRGEKIRIWDGASTSLAPRNRGLLDRAYTKFLDIAGYTPKKVDTDDLEERFLKLLATQNSVGRCTITPAPPPLLARTQSAGMMIAGVKCKIPESEPMARTKEEKESLHPEVNADDLQKKLDRLLNL